MNAVESTSLFTIYHKLRRRSLQLYFNDSSQAGARFEMKTTTKNTKFFTFLLWRPLKSGALGGCLDRLGLEPALVALQLLFY